jgi:DUF971 family protein
MQPTAISRSDQNSIVIQWDDGEQTTWTVWQLRKACPCATCREKKKSSALDAAKPKGLPVISAAEAKPLQIESMRPVGNYAYNILFSDGHGSGLFTFSMLHDGYDTVASKP